MKVFRMCVSAMALALFAGSVMADDVASLREELQDLKLKAAALESAQDSCGSCTSMEGCDSLVSMKKKGRVQIGGDIKVDVVVLHRDDTTSKDDEIDSTRFSTGEPYGAYLDFKINATDNSFLMIKLDLDDCWDEAAGQDDLLAECYFQFDNVFCIEDLSVIFGKKEFVDYGQDKFTGITPSFHDGWAYWMIGQEAFTPGDNANPHNTIGSNTMPTAAYRTFQVETIYNWCDMVTFYSTVFQNNMTTGGGRNTRGMHEDRSDDHLGWQSVAEKVEITAWENLTLEVSFCNWHIDSYQERALNPMASANSWQSPEDDMQALSVGFDYDFACLPLNIYGEYQHGWNWAFVDEADVDVAQLGLVYGICENIDFGLMGEYAKITELSSKGDDEEYWQAVGNVTYNLDSGIYMTLEYAHVWYESEGAGSVGDRDADMIGFRTGWEF